MIITIRKSDNKVIYFNQGNVENNPDYEEKNINIDFMPANIDGLYYDSITNTVTENIIVKLKTQKAEEIYNDCEYEMEYKNKGLQSAVINAYIDCRNIDILRLNQLIDLIEGTQTTENTVNYICYDNSIVQITFSQLKQIHLELVNNIMNMLYHKHYLYSLLNAESCDTEEEINAINWSW